MIATLGVRQGERLAGYTSLKVGGPAEAFVAGDVDRRARGRAALGARARAAGARHRRRLEPADRRRRRARGWSMRCLSARWRVEDEGDVPMLIADAGAPVSGVARALGRRGFVGFEWAATVPGTVGGAVVNNAGAFGGCMADCLALPGWSTPMARSGGVPQTISSYAYRTSVLKRGELGPVAVTRVAVRLRRGSAEESTARIAEYQAQRTRTQPRQRSAGSVFANPPVGLRRSIDRSVRAEGGAPRRGTGLDPPRQFHPQSWPGEGARRVRAGAAGANNRRRAVRGLAAAGDRAVR